MADNYLGYKMDDYLAGRLKPAKKKKKKVNKVDKVDKTDKE